MHLRPWTRPLARRDFLKGSMMGAAALVGGRPASAQQRGPLRAYVGTYTEGTGSEGIYHCLFDPATGVLRLDGATKGVRNPSFLALHPNGAMLYAVEEVNDRGADKSGGVVAFAVDPASGTLRERSRALSGGAHPAHISVHSGGAHVLVANYSGATVAVLGVDRSGGVLSAPWLARHQWVGPVRPRQEAPHPHSIYPIGERVYVADLGLDRIFTYGWDAATGTLFPLRDASLSLRAGDGPRHMAFHPQRRFAYVINELSSTITSLRRDPGTGGLQTTGTVSTLPAGYTGRNSCAHIQIHPNGRFVYGSNRGHDSIVLAEVAPDTGHLTVVQHHPTGGATPRNFTLDPSGRFLLAENQRTGSIVTLAVDPTSGRLSETGNVLQIPAPVCLVFAPSA
ncbi:MAG: lactonase family protein [Gemmatimonadetes bacterium]|nr:lactonase family protein [Gemmatimonadota bacterium]